VGLGLAFLAKPASAQKPGPEFGVQFVGFDMMNPDGSGNNSTNFGLGNGNVSVAFYMSEMIAIEPTLLFGYSKPEGGGDANSGISLNVAVPIYLNKGWGKAGGLFIAPHVGFTSASSGGLSGKQVNFGASVGTKLKITDALFWRVQAGFDMGQEGTGDVIAPKYTDIGASFGLSVYLH
jgi:hypothetical protein